MDDAAKFDKMLSAQTMQTEFTDYRNSSDKKAEARNALKKLIIVSCL